MNTTRTTLRTASLRLTTPLLPVAVGLLTGIVSHEYQPMSVFSYVGILAFATALSLVARLRLHLSWLLLGVAAWSAGALLHVNVTATNSPSNIIRYATHYGRIVRVRGIVSTKPRQVPPPSSVFSKWQRGNWRTGFLLEATAMETTHGWGSTVGRLRVSMFEPILDLEQGEAVELFGRLSALLPPANPGAVDWSTFNRRQGIVARLTVKHRENMDRKSLQLARSTSPSWLQIMQHHARSYLHRLLIDDFDQDEASQASLLDAMVLGQRSRVDRQLNDLFIRAGCAHFLAVSGVHVAIVMLLVALGCRLINLHPRKTTWVLIVSVLAYAIIAEPRPSVLRATVMALLYCVARLLSRQRASLNWLAASAICICVVDPNAAFNIGFQLSFIAVVGVINLGPAIVNLVKDLAMGLRSLLARSDSKGTQKIFQDYGVIVLADWRSTLGSGLTHAWHFVAGLATMSIGAWCATLPLVLIHFNQIHPWGAMSSIVLFPLISVSMALGFAKLVMGVLAAPLMTLVNGPLAAVNSLLLWCVKIFASLPYATVSILSPPWWLVVSFYVLALALIARYRIILNLIALKSWSLAHPKLDGAIDTAGSSDVLQNFNEPKDDRVDVSPEAERATILDSSTTELAIAQQTQHELSAQRQKRIAGIASLLSTALFSVALTTWLWPTQHKAELRVTCLAVGAGSATVLELASGETVLFDAGSSGAYDIGLGTVVPYLTSRKITAIDRVYITHANLDHFSGVPSISDTIDTGSIVINPYFQSPYAHSRDGKTSASTFLLEYLRQNDQQIEILNLHRRKWHIGDTLFELLWPPQQPLSGLTANNSSTVLRVTYAGQSILLTGDIEQRAESALLQAGNLHAEVLVLPHHGSIESTTAAFIRAVGATSLIQSAGRAGRTTTARLSEMGSGAKLFSTANSGAITVLFSKQGVQTLEHRPAAATPNANTNN